MNSVASEKTDNRNIRVVQFLDAYERQEDLWNPNSANYKNKSARDEAYAQIIKDLNMPFLSVNDVKLKVKSIRTTYKKELRMLNKRKEEGKNYFPKLFWFNRADCFLKNVSVSRNKCLAPKKLHAEDTKPFIIDYVETTEPAELEEPTEQIDEADEIVGQPNAGNSDIDGQSQNNLAILDPRRDDTGPLLTKLCYKSNDSKFVTNFGEQQASTTTSTTSELVSRGLNNGSQNPILCNNLAADDEYDLFCRSVAVQLRSIRDNYSRSVAKLKIQQILFEAETGHYRNTACVTIPVSQNLTTL